MPIFMKYEGIEGEARGAYKGWIVLESCQMGSHRNVESSSRRKGGKDAKPPPVSEILATKSQDCSSVHLFRESLYGSGGKRVVIDFVSGNGAPFVSVELENTVVANYEVSGSGGQISDRPLESFTLNFTRITKSTKPTATGKQPQGAAWGAVVGSS